MPSPLIGRPLDGMPTQCSGAKRFGFGGEHRTGKSSRPSPPFIHVEAARQPEIPPPSVDRPCHDRAEQRTDLYSGEKIAAPSSPASRLIEALAFVVERRVHIFRHRHRPLLRNSPTQPTHKSAFHTP